jgi:hypothetical protein
VNSAPPYRLVRSRSTAADFHGRSVPDPAPREIWQHDVTAPALVLGSTQDARSSTWMPAAAPASTSFVAAAVGERCC